LRNAKPQELLSRRGAAYQLLWGRDYDEEEADAVARRMNADVLIVGHTPCDDGILAPNRRHVILDSTGANGRYVILPLTRPVTQAAVLRAARRLRAK